MVRVAYLQTADELVDETLDVARLRREILAFASGSASPEFAEPAHDVAASLGHPVAGGLGSTAAMLPGNFAFTSRVKSPAFNVVAVMLECRAQTPAVWACVARYAAVCEQVGVTLHVLARGWRSQTGRAKWVAKARFELDILDRLEEHAVDVLVLDRAMFYVGVLIDPATSPIAHNVLNSHPGVLRGPACNAGKSPTVGALELKRDKNILYSGVTIHRATPAVDGGKILVDRRFSIADLDTPEQLRSRVYSGIEAAAQLTAFSAGHSSVDWQTRRPFDLRRAEGVYQNTCLIPAGAPASSS